MLNIAAQGINFSAQLLNFFRQLRGAEADTFAQLIEHLRLAQECAYTKLSGQPDKQPDKHWLSGGHSPPDRDCSNHQTKTAKWLRREVDDRHGA
jgi:hypothetical protein